MNVVRAPLYPKYVFPGLSGCLGMTSQFYIYFNHLLPVEEGNVPCLSGNDVKF